MSHEISTTNGQSSYAGRKPAWHRLGTVFERALTVEEAIEAAHLGGWNVRTLGDVTAVELKDTGAEIIAMPDRRAVVFDNPITGKTTYLGDVGSQFTPVQNEAQADFLQALLDEGGAFIETAGALREYRQVFFTAKLPTTMLVGGVDPVDLYLASLNGHEGSMSFKSIVTPVRIVCANTQHAALKSAQQSWSRRHRTGVHAGIEEARQDLNLTFKFAAEFEAEAEKMIQRDLTNAEFDKIISKMYGAPQPQDSKLIQARKGEKLDRIRGLYFDAETQANIRGTNWAGYQAISEYEDWFAKTRGADDEAKDKARAERAVDGRGVNRKEWAWELLKV